MTDLERQQRLAVCAEAREWIGTKYHENARVKCKRDASGKIIDGGGVDCVHSIVAWYQAVGLLGQVEIPKHSPQFMLHCREEIYLTQVRKYAREITREDMQPGDMAMFRFGHVYAHGVLCIEPGWPNIIHAPTPLRGGAGFVVEDFGDQGVLADRKVLFFSPW